MADQTATLTTADRRSGSDSIPRRPHSASSWGLYMSRLGKAWMPFVTTCKNRLPYNLYCVGGDVKHCTIQTSYLHTGCLRQDGLKLC